MKLKDLTPNEKNPRKISFEKLGQLKKALAKFGSLDGFIFNRTSGKLVSGHQRRSLASLETPIVITNKYDKPTKTGTVAEGYIEIDENKFPYREVQWDEATEKAANIAANKGAGEYDNEKLAEMLAEITAFDADFDLDLTMFDVDELQSLEVPNVEVLDPQCDEDEVPEFVEPKTKLGDIYTLGRHRLMCGDSTSIDAVEKLMAGKKADMVFTDPPYGVGYTGGHNEKKRSGIVNDTLEGESLSDLFAESLSCAQMVSKDHAAFYIWYANGKAVETFASFAQLSLTVRAVICWYKVKSGLGAFMSQYIPNYEPCIYAFKTGSSPQWFGPTDEKTVWELKRERVNEFHPTQKPVELPERALRNSSKEGDSVLDLFGGSGSTLIACEKSARTNYSMELDPKYCDVIVARWEKYTGKKAALVNSDLNAAAQQDHNNG